MSEHTNIIPAAPGFDVLSVCSNLDQTTAFIYAPVVAWAISVHGASVSVRPISPHREDLRDNEALRMPDGRYSFDGGCTVFTREEADEALAWASRPLVTDLEPAKECLAARAALPKPRAE